MVLDATGPFSLRRAASPAREECVVMCGNGRARWGRVGEETNMSGCPGKRERV